MARLTSVVALLALLLGGLGCGEDTPQGQDLAAPSEREATPFDEEEEEEPAP